MHRARLYIVYFAAAAFLLLGLSAELQTEQAYAAPLPAQSIATPVPLSPHPVLSDIVALQSVHHSTCALTSGGSVKCWGQYPSLAALSAIRLPVTRPGLEQGVKALSNGVGEVQCAVMIDGTARCAKGLEPLVTFGFAAAVRSVAAGGPLCALLVNGAVQCVGNNAFGQLGNGSFSQREEQPVYVKGLTGNVEAVVNGPVHSCVLLAGGQVQCWGRKEMLGANAAGDSSQPVQVSGLISNVMALTAGVSYTCALLADGSVRCWGDPIGLSADNRPVTITGLPAKAKAIERNCALLVNNSVACYGSAFYPRDHHEPWQLIDGLADEAIALSVTANHSCVLLTNGRVQCWGENQYDQLSTGRATQHTIPFAVQGIVSSTQAVTAGESRNCVFTAPDSLSCWGAYFADESRPGHPPSISPHKIANLGAGVKKMRMGAGHACALLDTGRVRCWGNSADWLGSLVVVTATNTITLYEPGGLNNGVVDVDATDSYACAVQDDGIVKCWGGYGLNQILNASPFTYYPTAVAVPGLNAVASAVATGAAHTCALAQTQEVFCWGINMFGQIGNGGLDPTYSIPSKVVGLPATVVAIAAGSYHTCALLSTGGVKCWGANFNGQLGNGTLADQGTAVDVIGLGSGVQALDLGTNHSCALLTDGGVKCWGGNGFGAIGNGTTTDQHVPAAVTGLAAGVKDISAGANHTCALLITRAVKCFGLDTAGQLGQGDFWQIPRYVVTGFIPQLSANFTNTQAGGIIALTGEHFPPTQTLLVRVNDVVYGTVQSSVLGEIFFLVDTQAMAATVIRIQVGDAATTQTLLIDPAAPLRAAEGGGQTIRLASTFRPLFLPWVVQK